MKKPNLYWTGSFLFFLNLALGCQFSFAALPSEPDTVLAAGKHYDRSALHAFFWGKHYRKVWAEPVTVPFIDLNKEAGGLKPIKKGGSYQTKNLRLENPAGKEYVLRSIDKDPTIALPARLRKSFIANVMQDQTSVIHPYGAFIIPPLAEAAGVFHTKPKLVVIPDDPALGEFREEFANMLALLEERPDGDQLKVAHFGNSKDVQSSRKMVRELVTENDAYVDARAYLRARLFDMWLGDWSRREDQWRWASYKKKGDLIKYLPIPRDRDHAFFKFNDGLMTKLIAIVKPNYQTFDPKFKNLKGLNCAAAPLDKLLLSFLSSQDFMQVADTLKLRLTDQVIADALTRWPENIYKMSASEFERKLKARRDQLPAVAREYYRILAENPELPGTDKAEIFKITALPGREVKVEVFDKGKKNVPDSLMSSRTFRASETKTIRIYGLDGDDKFEVSGEENLPIAISIFDGAGEDKIVDKRQKVSGKKVTVFDADDGNEIDKSKGLKVEKNYVPKAREFDGEGWLLRHRLD